MGFSKDIKLGKWAEEEEETSGVSTKKSLGRIFGGGLIT